MSRTSPRALALAAVSAVALSVSGAPASAATSRAEKRQNSAIKKTTTTAKKAGATARSANRKATAATDSATKAINEAKKANDGVGAINTTVVPAALKALGDLRDGLLALKTGLEAAGAGLTRLGDAYQSVEYGALRVFGTPAGTAPADITVDNSTPIPGFSANSADIPDDGNGALVAASLPVAVSDPDGIDLRVRAAIRSNEADGGATGDPAGQVGALLYAKCISDPCATPGPALEPGQVACVPAGPPADATFPLAGTQSLRNIQVKASRTGFVAPAFDAPLATSQDGTDSKCTLPGPGLYEVTLSGQFFDFPTSTTPGPKD